MFRYSDFPDKYQAILTISLHPAPWVTDVAVEELTNDLTLELEDEL